MLDDFRIPGRGPDTVTIKENPENLTGKTIPKNPRHPSLKKEREL
jgi:hypothetical protein